MYSGGYSIGSSELKYKLIHPSLIVKFSNFTKLQSVASNVFENGGNKGPLLNNKQMIKNNIENIGKTKKDGLSLYSLPCLLCFEF